MMFFSQGLDMEAYQSRLSTLTDDVFKKHSAYARKVSWSRKLSLQ